jgi:hypothetical protein
MQRESDPSPRLTLTLRHRPHYCKSLIASRLPCLPLLRLHILMQAPKPHPPHHHIAVDVECVADPPPKLRLYTA